MTTAVLGTANTQREILPLFHEMTPHDQDALWQAAQPHFAEETAYFEPYERYADIEAAANDVRQGLLVPVLEMPKHFGIAAPIRYRYEIPGNLGPDEESVPYLQRGAASVLTQLTEDFRCHSRRDDEFRETMQREGFSDMRLSVCSLLRTTQYQRFIATQGRFALGRDAGEVDVASTHEKGRALDIDHAAFYATRANTDEEIPLNRDSSPEDFRSLLRILPRFKTLLRDVITVYKEDDTVMALEEVPQGWGCWHIAVKDQ